MSRQDERPRTAEERERARLSARRAGPAERG